ncbi:hypothetical protein [Streptomyces indicus]|uniref:Uncharacterized protein n=1 Tax=Streptomyces indicus TaxID=417292 RepID=A0A1G9EUE3_9ACTN|nr:hypothetical protein [Streptomyces indicus]SDK79782.1 hypothetical protein SAMN05421806_11268 [Streptomyces indicus]
MGQAAYDVAVKIAQSAGWDDLAPQPFGEHQARLWVSEDEYWLGVSTSSTDSVVHLAAGRINADGTAAAPAAETIGSSEAFEDLMAGVAHLWVVLDSLTPLPPPRQVSRDELDAALRKLL